MLFAEWLGIFEMSDKEPPLDILVNNKFLHKNSRGFYLGSGVGFRTEDVDAHVAWHHRMTKAFIRDKEIIR